VAYLCIISNFAYSTTKYYADSAVPYISRVTTGGKILYVEGYSGVTTVWQIDVSTGISGVRGQGVRGQAMHYAFGG